MNNLLKKELQADAETFGDDRRSPRASAKKQSDERARHAAV